MANVVAPTKPLTIHDLEQYPNDGKRRELVGGEIVEWDVATYRHGFFEAALVEYLRRFVRERRLGRIVCGDPMVRIQGSEHDARGADIAFYRRGRYPRDVDAGATIVVPDFVIEILAPTDRASQVDAKVDDWPRAGVELLWYVNPETGGTTVYGKGVIRRISALEPLDGGDLLPGLQPQLQDVFDELDAEDETEGWQGPRHP